MFLFDKVENIMIGLTTFLLPCRDLHDPVSDQ
jgi:hypothetical protein